MIELTLVVGLMASLRLSRFLMSTKVVSTLAMDAIRRKNRLVPVIANQSYLFYSPYYYYCRIFFFNILEENCDQLPLIGFIVSQYLNLTFTKDAKKCGEIAQ